MKLSVVVLVSTTLIYCCCFSVATQNSCGMSTIDRIYRNLELTRQLFARQPQRYNHNFGSLLPPSLMNLPAKTGKLIESLLTLMEMKEQFEQLTGSDQVFSVVRVISDTMYSDACNYLNETFGIPCELEEMRRVLLALHFRDTVLSSSYALRDTGYMPNNDQNWMYIQYERAFPTCEERKKYINIFGRYIRVRLQETISNCNLQPCDIA